jgi:hypothetical protein
MEKNEVYIDENVKYFSWSESASIILKLRKKINEGMQMAEGSILEHKKEKEMF